MGQHRYCFNLISVILFLTCLDHVIYAFILLAPLGSVKESKNNFTLLNEENVAVFNTGIDEVNAQIFTHEKLYTLFSGSNEETTLANDAQQPNRHNIGEDWTDTPATVGSHHNPHHMRRWRSNNDSVSSGTSNDRLYWNQPSWRLKKTKPETHRDVNIGGIASSSALFNHEELKMPKPFLSPRLSRDKIEDEQQHRVKRRARASVIVRVPPSPAFRSSKLHAYIASPRGSRLDAKVGVLVVADYSVFKQYMEANENNAMVAVARIRRYYGMVFSMINERFQTIKDPYLSISVSISGILIAERPSNSPWTEQIVDWSTKGVHGRASVDTASSLKGFSKWLDGREGLPDFDHAMVFTAYRLMDPNGVGLGGMAYLEAVCDTKSGNAVSIVGDKGDFQSVRVATHELAHSLGATHDGERGAEACPSRQAYIMSSMTTHNQHAPLRNAFYFSKCSIKDMTKHLSKSRSSCVRNKPPVYYHYELERFPPGRIYSADLQCKLIFGVKSQFCGSGNLADVMCGQLWCRDPNHEKGCRTNSYLTALPGTPCGRLGMCKLGTCVLDRTRLHASRTTSSIHRTLSHHRNHTHTASNNTNSSIKSTVIRASTIVRGKPMARIGGSRRVNSISGTSSSSYNVRNINSNSNNSRNVNSHKVSKNINTNSHYDKYVNSHNNRTTNTDELRGISSSNNTSKSNINSNNRNRNNRNSNNSKSNSIKILSRSARIQARVKSNVIPNTHKIRRPSHRRRRPRRNRRHRSRARGRSGSRRRKQRKNRGKRKGRCKEDKNVEYCRGLIKLNPGGCRRKAIRQYCCATCKMMRRKRKGRNRSRERKRLSNRGSTHSPIPRTTWIPPRYEYGRRYL